MKTGRASKTALGVAIRRAAHQLMDDPPILVDPIAVPLIGRGHQRLMERAMHPVGRDFRAFMAVRSRYTEDRLADAVGQGVSQYVVLGAGLDTFAYRNPFAGLRVFEVDFPATQEGKRAMLAEAEIPIPENLTFVPLDFEYHTLAEGLVEAGFEARKPAYFGWLGVVPYLTLEAFRSTVTDIARLPAGTAVSFDYALSPETLSLLGRMAFDRLAERVAAAGEPFQLFFTKETLELELRRAGFRRVEQLDYEQINERYFKDRADGLKLSAVKLAMLVAAWV
ncbi:MAG: class I SAM-dependent methyltransferase [Terracidiphilus sp.]|jgi:methyltransferase (TIGR00027 family)